tara:strand:- start:196 stop:1020 length:825 start_codon:yes stop_codon:yes gene_type:complete
MLIFPTYQTILTKPAATSSFSGVTTNLTAHWDLGNSSSYSAATGVAINDLTNNNNDGSIVNSSNFSYSSSNGGHGVINSSATSNYCFLRRDTDYIKDVGTDDFTIEYWWNLYWDERGADNADDINSFFKNLPNNSSPYAENVDIQIRSGKLRVSNWLAASGETSAGSWTYLDSSAVYTLNSYNGWEHVVLSRIGTDNNNMKFYRNNSLIHTWTNKARYDDANTSSSDRRTSFGLYNDKYYAVGKFAIYRFYTGTGLTSSQVTTNYNVDKSRFGL